MDREFLADLFSPFGPVTIRRMFSGFGVSADGVTFALVIQDAIYLRTDADGAARFEAERSRPFRYDARDKTVTVASYWLLPERLLDDPEEFSDWARIAFAVAERAALAKAARKPRKAAIKTGTLAKREAKSAAKAVKKAGAKTAKAKAATAMTEKAKTAGPKRSRLPR
uniref:TfoX domain protein n=1 Tax=Rhodopseudomonas palustris (strain DX-1) TaxID=652103 RepID=E6VLZ9_RHOPX